MTTQRLTYSVKVAYNGAQRKRTVAAMRRALQVCKAWVNADLAELRAVVSWYKERARVRSESEKCRACDGKGTVAQ